MDNDNFFNSNAADIIQHFSPEAVNAKNIKKISDNVDDISFEAAYLREEVSRLNCELAVLHKELSDEKQRAEAEENRSKRLSFLLGILGGLCSGVLPYILDKLFSLW
ncbi:MAG: hypothetical protein II656_07360 [Ruminococcus sp.]|nr:hypothetical protein [Ruminococcus sp.]